ncbi:MAG: hypothetical protein C0424_06810 [Sphingobacteriaceae bacterium]|nr:hypothetical protein [Sphingobacteriaceae bacterium]
MEQKRFFEKPMIKWGLLLGGLLVVALFLVYSFDAASLVSIWYSILTLAFLPIIFMVLANIELKRSGGNVLLYGDAVMTNIVIGLISSVLSIAATYVLYNFIDPSLPEFLKNTIIEKTTGYLERSGMPDSDIEQVLENLERQDYKQTIKTAFSSLLIASAVNALLGLIVGAFTKRVPDLFEESTDAGA